jgi:hypothetical protein
MHVRFALGVIPFLLTACSYVEQTPIPYHPYPENADPKKRALAQIANDDEDSGQTGVRAYQGAPYLLVYGDGKGNLVWKIYYLLDQTKLMSINPQQFVAKTVSNVTLNNGVITNAHTENDSTAVLKAGISSLEKVLPLLAAADNPANPAVPAPRIYKIIIVTAHQWKLVGTETNDVVYVNVK